jgi:hypothetical protein
MAKKCSKNGGLTRHEGAPMGAGSGQAGLARLVRVLQFGRGWHVMSIGHE